MSKAWFITGTSRGFGRIWTEAALERGDRVAAAARNVGTLSDLAERYGPEQLLPLTLDVTDKPQVDETVKQAHDHFGRIDVVVNNAGWALFGSVEEVTEQQARDQLETNFFGALWVTKAALPLLRAQCGGHILQISAVGGVDAGRNLGLYHASKWALEGMSQALAAEVEPLGIKVTLIEPTAYGTDLREGTPAARAMDRTGRRATARAIFAVVDAERPPLRLFLGDGPLAMIRMEYARRLDEWERWNDVAVAAESLEEVVS